MSIEKSRYTLAAAAVVVLLAAFLYVSHTILSPILIGFLLLFFLSGLKESPVARRLWAVTAVILFLWLLIKAQMFIIPLIASFVLAYLFDPLADILERRRVGRTAATIILLVLTLGILVLFGIILIPGLIIEIQQLIGRIPALAQKASVYVQNNLPRLLEFLKIDNVKFQQSILEEIPKRSEQVLNNLLKSLTGLGAFLSQLLNLVLIPVLTFYILKDFDRIKTYALDFVPRKYRSAYHFYLWRLNRILGGYIRGQIIVCTIVGVLTGAGLALFRIPFAIILGLVTGFLNVIPFLGFYISFAIVLLSGFFTSHVVFSLIKIAAVFLGVQALEAYIITPKVVGERVGLHPVVVILSVLLFSRFLGFWGLILGVPSAALLKLLAEEWKRRRKWMEVRRDKSAPPD